MRVIDDDFFSFMENLACPQVEDTTASMDARYSSLNGTLAISRNYVVRVQAANERRMLCSVSIPRGNHPVLVTHEKVACDR
jgi:hypothetical protein